MGAGRAVRYCSPYNPRRCEQCLALAAGKSWSKTVDQFRVHFEAQPARMFDGLDEGSEGREFRMNSWHKGWLNEPFAEIRENSGLITLLEHIRTQVIGDF